MKKTWLLVLSSYLATTGFSQQGLSLVSIRQSTQLPVGSLKSDFVNNISARGLSFDFGYFINDNLTFGLATGYSDLYQKKDRQTYTYPETDISAVKSHSLQMIPILIKAGYNRFKDGSVLQPYAAIGAGVNIVNYQEWFGTLVDERNALRFAFAPEIGTRIAFSSDAMNGVDLSLRYQYTAFKYNDVKNLQTVSLNLGFYFLTRN